MILNCARIYLINKEIESISNFNFEIFVETHLDVVLEVLLMAGLDFPFYKTCTKINITGRFIEKIRMIDL